MKQHFLLASLLLLTGVRASAQNEVIDISGDNTDKNYVSYNTFISLPAGKTV